jgi:DNA invertase Pin-like site-specific DNA recombinase
MPRPLPPDALTTAALYTRVSSDEQQREGTSLDAQLAECRRYAAQHGWVIGHEWQDVLSGTRDDRPQYQALLADVRRLRADGVPVVVVVAALDRFGRRLLERVRAREELKALGVAVHAVRDGGEVSDLVANVLGAVAQEEVRRLGERVRATRQHYRQLGWYPPGRPPWGYCWRPATEAERLQGSPARVLDRDPETAPHAVEMLRRIADGGSITGVVRWAATLPSAARGGRVLSYHGIYQLLRTPVYQGIQPGSTDVVTPGRWPALVDAATAAQVQARLGRAGRIPVQATGRYLLTGLARCPRCGARMCGWAGAGRRPAAYRCYGTPRLVPPLCSYYTAHAPPDRAVRAAVVALLRPLLAGSPTVRRHWRALQQPPAAPTGQRQALERMIVQARRRLTQGTILLVDAVISPEEYAGLRDQAQRDLAAAAAELATLPTPVTAPRLPPWESLAPLLQHWEHTFSAGSLAAQRAVLPELVEQVVLARPAVIHWTPIGQHLRALSD